MHTGAVPSDTPPTAAEVSSLVDQVEVLAERVATAGTASDRSPTEDLAAALYDAERSLRAAGRALRRAGRSLG